MPTTHPQHHHAHPASAVEAHSASHPPRKHQRDSMLLMAVQSVLRRLEAGGLGSAAGSRVDATLELTGAQSSAVDECESLSLPDDADGLRGLMDEAEFFQLGELQHKCAEALDLLQLRRVDPRAGSGGVAGAWPPLFMFARCPPPLCVVP